MGKAMGLELTILNTFGLRRRVAGEVERRSREVERVERECRDVCEAEKRFEAKAIRVVELYMFRVLDIPPSAIQINNWLLLIVFFVPLGSCYSIFYNDRQRPSNSGSAQAVKRA